MSADDVSKYKVKQLYEALSKQLSRDTKQVAKILKKKSITGADFLRLTDDDALRLFPDNLGYRITLQQLIASHQQQDKMEESSSKGPCSPTALDQSPPSYNSSDQMHPAASKIHSKAKSRSSLLQKFGKIGRPRRQQIPSRPGGQQVEVGPPAVYKLELQEKNFDEKSKIASYVVNCGQSGTVDQDASHKVLLIVGATGTGKSTLINALVNHFLEVTFSDPYRYTIITHKDEGGRSQAHSQTSWIKAYTFLKQPGSPVPYALTIIDTPGYGDTRGIDCDRSITTQIKYFFESKELGVDHVNAIAFVVKASDNRLSSSQKYIFTEILKLFGKDIEECIMIVATHADGRTNKAEQALKETGVPVQEKHTFLVNNGELFGSNIQNRGTDNSFVAQSEMHWKRNAKTFAEMEVALGQMVDTSVWQSAENLKEREALQAVLEGIGPQIRELTNNAQNMKQTSEEIKKHEHEMDENKDFKFEVTETVAEKVMVELEDNQKSLNCRTCKSTCHFPCTSTVKRMCRVISFWGNKCSVCTDKCPAASHSLETFKHEMRYVETTKEMTKETMKTKYNDAKKYALSSKQILNNLENDRMKLLIQGAKLAEKAKGCISRIREISLNPSPATEEDYIDMLISKEKDEMEDGWQDRIKSLDKLKEVSQLAREIGDTNYKDNNVALMEKLASRY